MVIILYLCAVKKLSMPHCTQSVGKLLKQKSAVLL